LPWVPGSDWRIRCWNKRPWRARPGASRTSCGVPGTGLCTRMVNRWAVGQLASPAVACRGDLGVGRGAFRISPGPFPRPALRPDVSSSPRIRRSAAPVQVAAGAARARPWIWDVGPRRAGGPPSRVPLYLPHAPVVFVFDPALPTGFFFLSFFAFSLLSFRLILSLLLYGQSPVILLCALLAEPCVHPVPMQCVDVSQVALDTPARKLFTGSIPSITR